MNIIWLVLAFLFFVLELGHPGLFMFLSIGFGFLGAFFAALLDFSLTNQIFVLFVVIFASYKFLRIKLKKWQPKELKTNIDALIGKNADLLKRENNNIMQVKVGDQIWSASFEDDLELEGTVFEVKRVKGCRLINRKEELR